MRSLFLTLIITTSSLGEVRYRPKTVRTDLIELNHFYDEKGKLVFNQFIFWDYVGSEKLVRAWRFDKGAYRLERKRGYCRYLTDEVIVVAPIFQETWTQYDPEVRNRKYLAKCYRRGI